MGGYILSPAWTAAYNSSNEGKTAWVNMIAIAPIRSWPDGSVATIPMSWAEYQQLIATRGNHSIPRLKYVNGHLTLKMSTFEHGQLDAIVADLIVAILNQQLRDYIRTTPITLQIPEQAGIEPDH